MDQVTELKCGGLFVGCTFDHRAADAYSANMFLVTWAEIAQSKPLTRRSSFRRSLFNPRRPSQPHKSIDKLFGSLLHGPPPSSAGLVSRIYRIKSVEIDCLHSQVSCNGTRRSKIESFSAFLWKLLAAAAAGDDLSKTLKLGVVIDGRKRLCSETMPLEGYFGNVLSIPYAEASARELHEMSLEEGARMVHECIAVASTAEHFLALVDWVELLRPEPAVARAYCKDENDEASVVVSSGRSFPIRELDFGWGTPDFGSYYFPWGGESGCVMPMPCVSGNGDWIVFMHLMARHLVFVESHAPHVFKPFKWNE